MKEPDLIEQDVIGHLIDVERLAYEMLLDAETESDKRKAAAKEIAELEYRASYEKIITRLESEQIDGRKLCDNSRDLEYTAFNNHLDSIQKDQSAFSAYLDSVFFGQ